MIDDNLSQKVKLLWKVYSAETERDRKPKGDDLLLFDKLKEELMGDYGFLILEAGFLGIDYDAFCDAVYRGDGMRLPGEITDPAVHELIKNVKRHAFVYSPDGREFDDVGQCVFMRRFYREGERKVFEMYLFDKGPGFARDTQGIPRIEEATKPNVSLSPGGECGLGLNTCLDRSDFWEIDSCGYRLAKGSPLEKTDYVQGALIHLVKVF